MKAKSEISIIQAPIGKCGRLVIPQSIRQTMNITIGSVVEFHNEGNGTFLLRACQEGNNCVICHSPYELQPFPTGKSGPIKYICRTCMEKIRKDDGP